MINSPLTKIKLQGKPYDRGYQYGSLLKSEIHKFLNNKLAHINWVRPIAISKENALTMIKPYIAIIEEEIPEIAIEIRGLAEGANISYEEAMLLQLRREILGFGLECSSIAFVDQEGQTVIAQNVDLPGKLVKQGLILQSLLPNGTHILQYTFTGLLGYLGLNNHGIAIGINMVLSAGWGPGVPIYLLVRHLLQQTNLEACLTEIRRIKRASSRSLFLTDGIRLVNVEMSVDAERITEKPCMVHTNHYLHPDFRSLDRIHMNASSFHRKRSLDNFVNSKNGKMTANQVKTILSDHENAPASVCVHGTNDPKRSCTVASTFLYPSKKLMSIARGNPCQNDYIDYAIC